MQSPKAQSFDVAGYEFFGYVDRSDNDRCWFVLSRLAEVLGVDRGSVTRWVNKHQSDVDQIFVNYRNNETRAYSSDVLADFVDMRVRRFNCPYAYALQKSIVRADLERSLKEASGIRVTSIQHEENRKEIRLHILGTLLHQYNPRITRSSDPGVFLSRAEMDQFGLSKDEREIAGVLAYIKVRLTKIRIERNKKKPDLKQIEIWQDCIKDIQRNTVRPHQMDQVSQLIKMI